MGEAKDKVKGHAKDVAGRATGRRRTQVEGKGLKARGKVREGARKVKRAAS